MKKKQKYNELYTIIAYAQTVIAFEFKKKQNIK